MAFPLGSITFTNSPKPPLSYWNVVVRPGPVPEGGGRDHIEKAPAAFDIDMLRCIYCGLCQEVCPEEAIFLLEQYSMSGYSRAEMVNHKERLYELGGTLPDFHRKWDRKKAAEAARGRHD